MAKLYFKYGVMGSSKSAQALMCRFNYVEKGFNVLLIKSNIDTRDMKDNNIVIKSRIGLSEKCEVINKNDDLYKFVKDKGYLNEKSVVIVDEAQFLTKQQVEQLKEVSTKTPVLCYGLLTNFKTELFEGSKRLVEIADSLQELKSVCRCGNKANTNGRFINGKLVTDGDEIMIGGNDTYEALCYHCYTKLKEKSKQSENNKETAKHKARKVKDYVSKIDKGAENER